MNSPRLGTFLENPLPSRSRGIALIAVLWVLLLLSALAATGSFIARTDAVITRRALEFAQAEAAADAAIVSVLSRLSDEQVRRHPAVGSQQSWDFDGIPVSIFVSDEAGRIDMNSASDELILAFLYSQGINRDAAVQMLRELREWQHPQSAAPKRELRTVEDLRRVPKWDSPRLQCWSDSLTVYTALPGVSAAAAGPRVDAALNLLQERSTSPLTDDATTMRGPPRAQSVIGEALRILARATVANGVVATRLWVGRLTGDPNQPTLAMRWDQGGGSFASGCKGQ
jgi:hypothetical protein